MLKEDITYTYDDILEIFMEASAKTLETLNEKANNEIDGIGKMMFQMQNQMVITLLNNTLFIGDRNGNN